MEVVEVVAAGSCNNDELNHTVIAMITAVAITAIDLGLQISFRFGPQCRKDKAKQTTNLQSGSTLRGGNQVGNQLVVVIELSASGKVEPN